MINSCPLLVTFKYEHGSNDLLYNRDNIAEFVWGSEPINPKIIQQLKHVELYFESNDSFSLYFFELMLVNSTHLISLEFKGESYQKENDLILLISKNKKLKSFNISTFNGNFHKIDKNLQFGITDNIIEALITHCNGLVEVQSYSKYFTASFAAIIKLFIKFHTTLKWCNVTCAGDSAYYKNKQFEYVAARKELTFNTQTMRKDKIIEAPNKLTIRGVNEGSSDSYPDLSTELTELFSNVKSLQVIYLTHIVAPSVAVLRALAANSVAQLYENHIRF